MVSNKSNKASKRKRQVIEVERQIQSFTRKDILAWRKAWQQAMNPDNPDRRQLYDIYRDCIVDNHLSGCIEQRVGFTLARSFKISDKKGENDVEATEIFNSPWFKEFMRFALEARYWGHSLIELGEPEERNGKLEFSSVTLIPRKNVIPEFGRVLHREGDPIYSGLAYREDPAYYDWLVEVGKPDDLGLLLKAAQQCISKRNVLAFWDTFAEIFGMPFRIAKMTSRDPEDIARVEDTLKRMGSAGYALLNEGSEIDVVEAARGDAFNVFNERINRCNSELSKLILGQTMTIEDGSSLSQSQTHLTVLQNLIESDCDFLRDAINSLLIPRMIKHGFKLDGMTFDWDYSIDYTPEQQVAYEQMVLNNFDISPDYFVEKYGIPILGKTNNGGEMKKFINRFFD